MHLILAIVLLFCQVICLPTVSAASNFDVQKIADGIYAALAVPGGKAVSNAMFVVTSSEVILAGAHFVNETTRELVEEIGKISPHPIRHVILTHHHRGYNYVDFDLPPKAEVVTSRQSWQSLKSELREFQNPLMFFDDTMTLVRDSLIIVLVNSGAGHSEGDVIVYLPKENILFASDLLFNDMVGFMGDASIRDWAITLEELEGFSARVVIPGVGKVTDSYGIGRFKVFFREFTTEVIRNIEKGNSLSQTKKEFVLDQYKNIPGFKTFLDVNLERAYKELKPRL